MLVALVGSRAEEKIAAPVPKDTPLLTIDGKYTLLSVSTPADRADAGRALGRVRALPAVVLAAALAAVGSPARG